MTGYDAAEQYIEKIAGLSIGNIGKTIWGNLQQYGRTLPNSIEHLYNQSRRYAPTMGRTGALKNAVKETVFKGLGSGEMGKLKNVAYGAGILGAGTVGLGVGNSIANKTRANTPPPPTDVQVVYANPYNAQG